LWVARRGTKMHGMPKILRSGPATLVAVVALSLAMIGTAAAGPSAAKITTAKVKKIAKAQIVKAAPGLSVKNAGTVGGRSVDQLRTVLAGAENSTVVSSIGTGGFVVVSVNYVLAAPSSVHFSGVAELSGDGTTEDEATCEIKNDGVTQGLNFEVKFDDVGTENAAVIPVLSTAASVPAGSHVATLVCARNAGSGTIGKDDAAIQITAVPN
jgi:hypothetical protein